jgi:hypothetical protein
LWVCALCGKTRNEGDMRKESKAYGNDDAPCFDEYLIAHYILNKDYSKPDELINDVANKFKLKREIAVMILDSRSFNRILDQMIKVKDTLLGIIVINGLARVIETGSIKEKMKAIDMLCYLYKHR